MAATKVTGGRDQNIVNLTAIDADWDDGGYRPLSSIQFNPGSDGTDVLVVRDGSATGVIIAPLKCASTTDGKCKYFDLIPCHVFIDYSECTLSAGHEVVLTYGEGGSWNG